jgi:NAD(P)-dependent dehydrogenase (short-subunit alcohol dehydrogenase family)
MKTWFITGASRGFGRLVAQEALRRGDQVVAAARKPEIIADQLPKNDRLLTVALDVTEELKLRRRDEPALGRQPGEPVCP